MGKAKNLKRRVSSYFRETPLALGPKTKILVSQIAKIRTVPSSTEIEALLLEANYIKKYEPKYNSRLTDDKEYPFIRITVKERYPKVLISRRMEDKNSTYFGPFPHASAMRLVLKTIRRVFSYQSSFYHPRRVCLYNHLGLCPCPPVYDSKEFEREYRKNINYLVQFLKGKSGKLIKELEKERNTLAKNENFEKAGYIQRQIDAVKMITVTYVERFDSDINPNLREDETVKAILELREYLISNGVNVNNLDRIECYDISNISGTLAVGSMIVFTHGLKNSALYRRFRIRTLPPKPNDFAMLREVMLRRLDHNEWDFPGLIIVDGGKGQVSTVVNAVKDKKMEIPVVGIAKREEIIITSDFKEIKLPKNSEALKLVMRIRDEVHRFAISYHRKLRGNYLLTTS